MAKKKFVKSRKPKDLASSIDFSKIKMPEIERVPTGVKGFDELIEGGVPRNAFVLLAGGAGTGKTIFAMNFLAYGALNGEKGIYVSLEENYDQNKLQMVGFGMDLTKLVSNREVLVLEPKIYDFDKLIESILDAIDSVGAKRLVIDSISVLELYFEDRFKTRRSIVDLANALKKTGVTTLAISETKEEKVSMSRSGVEEFVADGVIMLLLDKKENVLNRAISVRKMRATNHSLKIRPVQIKKREGFVVYPFEESFETF